MFDYQFNNGTGVRCWVAGYGKDDESGDFSFIQRKVDVPVFSNRNLCNNKLKSELAKTSPRTAANFQLTAGEICAGGEQGKDSCDGDGGAPLVCLFTIYQLFVYIYQLFVYFSRFVCHNLGDGTLLDWWLGELDVAEKVCQQYMLMYSII